MEGDGELSTGEAWKHTFSYLIVSSDLWSRVEFIIPSYRWGNWAKGIEDLSFETQLIKSSAFTEVHWFQTWAYQPARTLTRSLSYPWSQPHVTLNLREKNEGPDPQKWGSLTGRRKKGPTALSSLEEQFVLIKKGICSNRQTLLRTRVNFYVERACAQSF